MALANLGDRRALQPLIALLKDKDAWVRYSAAKALGELGDRRAIGPLESLLDDEDVNVRRAATEALAGLRAGGEAKP